MHVKTQFYVVSSLACLNGIQIFVLYGIGTYTTTHLSSALTAIISFVTVLADLVLPLYIVIQRKRNDWFVTRSKKSGSNAKGIKSSGSHVKALDGKAGKDNGAQNELNNKKTLDTRVMNDDANGVQGVRSEVSDTQVGLTGTSTTSGNVQSPPQATTLAPRSLAQASTTSPRAAKSPMSKSPKGDTRNNLKRTATLTISKIRNDPILLSQFRTHLKKSYALEGLVFLEAVDNYRANMIKTLKTTTLQIIKRVTTEITNEFLLETSTQEINIPKKYRVQVQNNIEDVLGGVAGKDRAPFVFDVAEEQVELMMTNDHLVKFEKYLASLEKEGDA
eukprot:jgi/Hompol1/3862/HPOL_006793-RA